MLSVIIIIIVFTRSVYTVYILFIKFLRPRDRHPERRAPEDDLVKNLAARGHVMVTRDFVLKTRVSFEVTIGTCIRKI